MGKGIILMTSPSIEQGWKEYLDYHEEIGIGDIMRYYIGYKGTFKTMGSLVSERSPRLKGIDLSTYPLGLAFEITDIDYHFSGSVSMKILAPDVHYNYMSTLSELHELEEISGDDLDDLKETPTPSPPTPEEVAARESELAALVREKIRVYQEELEEERRRRPHPLYPERG